MNIKNNKYVIVDCEILKSVDGSEGVGKNCTDRGRNGINRVKYTSNRGNISQGPSKADKT